MSGASARFTAQRDENTEEEYTPEEEISENAPEEAAEYRQEQPSDEVIQEAAAPASAKAHENISSLIENLRGKIGREELIILLVMFLIASDGMCAEVLILALVLLAA